MHPMKVLTALALIGCGARAGTAVPTDPTKVTPVAVGERAPRFTAREVDGRPFTFNPSSLPAPVIIIFYRGGWCPYCNMHLQDLRSVEPTIVAMGYTVLFLSTDRPALLYSSLQEPVNYHILSDSSMQAARAFKVAYRLDDKTVEKMLSLGVDLKAVQGTDTRELPVPSMFIIDRSGVIRFRHYDANYRVRLDAASVLAAAEQVRH
jgi:peroxiredoxin